MEIELILDELSYHSDLYSEHTRPRLRKQLVRIGTNVDEESRFRVDVQIDAGAKSPHHDVDNFVKDIMDAITYEKLVWKDDSQIDEIHVRRTKHTDQPNTMVLLKIQPIN